jgi:transcriptional regulator with PAS, ATPase and Fis domain
MWIGIQRYSDMACSLTMSLQSMEKLLIREALRRHKGNRTKAALQLRINPSMLYRKMKALSIESGDKEIPAD